jgi:hypothetical protein
MNHKNYNELQLVDQLQLLGDISNPDPDLCNAIELKVIQLIKQGSLQAIGEAVKAHQQAFGLTLPQSKLPKLASFTEPSVTEEHPKLKHLTWHFPAINPIRRLLEAGDYAAIKPLWRHFTGFTPSGLVVGSPPNSYGQEMDRIQAGSAFSGIAAEGLDTLIFKLTAKKPFADVIKLYGKGDYWLEGKSILEIIRHDQAPLDTFHIWGDEMQFDHARHELFLTTGISHGISLPLYSGQGVDDVIENFIADKLSDPYSCERFKFWIGRLLADKVASMAVLNRITRPLLETQPGKPEMFMNESFINTQKAISLAAERLIPGSQHKVMHALLVGQAEVMTDFATNDLFRELAGTMVDRKALLAGLDKVKVKSLERCFGWPECLQYVGLKDLGKRFGEDLGL